MSKEIKTREVVKDIKVHNATVNVGDRMKNIGVKTKDTVNENINHSDNVSPEQYSSDKITEAMKSGLLDCTPDVIEVVDFTEVSNDEA